MQDNLPPKMLTRKEVAEILGVHPNSIKNYEKAGIITPVRITTATIRYKYTDVEALMEKGANA